MISQTESLNSLKNSELMCPETRVASENSIGIHLLCYKEEKQVRAILSAFDIWHSFLHIHI